jgi:hypothetical protein
MIATPLRLPDAAASCVLERAESRIERIPRLVWPVCDADSFAKSEMRLRDRPARPPSSPSAIELSRAPRTDLHESAIELSRAPRTDLPIALPARTDLPTLPAISRLLEHSVFYELRNHHVRFEMLNYLEHLGLNLRRGIRQALIRCLASVLGKPEVLAPTRRVTRV